MIVLVSLILGNHLSICVTSSRVLEGGGDGAHMAKLGRVEAKGRAWLGQTIGSRDNRGRTQTLTTSRICTSRSVLVHPPLPGGSAPTAINEKCHK